MSQISYIFEDDFLPYRKLFLHACPPPLFMPKGTTICKRGHTRGWMYYLLNGMVKVYTTNFYGYDRHIGYMKKNTLFSLDCIEPDMTSVVNIESLTDINVLLFTGETIKKIMAKNASFAYDLVVYYCKITRQLAFDVENQSINDATTRLVNFLYLLTKSPGYEETQKIDLTQESLASAINSSRVHVSRICRELKNKGIIKIYSKGLSIEDSEELHSLRNF